ncbi:MAG: beta-galactosidase [Oscillospiraceae bacterium]|nr:beta-galactosidase [Oscillospiraceae bacterium]
MNIPRPEYPRPQMERAAWQNLNGQWQFEIDCGMTGKDRGLLQKDKLDMEITVPFCPESRLSGVEHKDFMNAVWYKREFAIPADWSGGRTLLNFEAVDYYCEVYINGKLAGSHKGGYTPFSFDITDLLEGEKNTVIVYAEDQNRTGMQPCGKQAGRYISTGCHYTRTTGIWQTVWLENVPQTYLKSYEVYPDPDNSKVRLTLHFGGDIFAAKEITALAKFKGDIAGKVKVQSKGSSVDFCIALDKLHLWQPLDAKLYKLDIKIKTKSNTDKVKGYFGMRKVELAKDCMLINGRRIFQRLVLDQGFYPDGIYTAPSDNDLKKDIELSLAFGFNGARLHERVFERRFLYHADRMGYMVWGEYANWGLHHNKAEALGVFLPEWIESVKRDFNSPALIGWCPFNETWDVGGCKQDDEVLRNVYLATKAIDHTRPVIDTSGNYHVVTDIFDVHNYQQDVEKFTKDYETLLTGQGKVYGEDSHGHGRQKYEGQPYFVSEYGGIAWYERDKSQGWGYGNAPETLEEFVDRYIGLTDALLRHPKIFALCYTQLYDVEQEHNGLYYYDRTPKFDAKTLAKLKKAMKKVAEIER